MSISERGAQGASEGAGVVEHRTSRGTSRHAAWGFWSVIAIFFALTMGLALYGFYRTDARPESAVSPDQAAKAAEPTEVTIPRTTVEQWIERAATRAEQQTLEAVLPNLNEAFAPVYAAIPAYADFHFSVIGEYVELAEAALVDRMSSSLEERLYAGMEERLERASDDLDQQFGTIYRAAIADQLENDIPDGMQGLPLSEATEVALNDALQRAAVGKPISLAVATGASAASMKVMASMIGKKMVAKTAVKLAAKGTTIGSGAASGAAIGTFLGPIGMAVGGAAGGVVAWVAADAVVVNVDEWFNRDGFEAELRGLVDAEKARLQQAIEAQITENANKVAGRTIQQVREQERAR